MYLPEESFDHLTFPRPWIIHRQIPDSIRPLSRRPSVVLSSSAASILEVCINGDNNGGSGLDLLTKATNDVAREIGEMDPDDPVQPERVKELYALTELIKLTKAQRNKLIYEKMDALAREIGRITGREPSRHRE